MDLSSFSDSMLAGQRLLAGFAGPGFNDDLRHLIESLKVAGIVLFSENLEDPQQIREMCADAQSCAADCGLPPLFIAIDQEGGTVARLGDPFTRFPGNPHIVDDRAAEQFGRVTAEELFGVGINMNFAPVLDVAALCPDSIMKDRSFPGGPDEVARLGGRVIDSLQAGGVMAVAKHFPGLGRTTADTHIDLPELDTVPEDMIAADLVPFQAAVDREVAAVMLSHVLYSGWDRHWPAGMSDLIVRNLLREKMGFAGVVMTDDLDMGAVARHYDMATVVDRAVAADVDLVMVCHKGPARQLAADTLLSVIRSDAAARTAAERSVRRVLSLKNQYLRPNIP